MRDSIKNIIYTIVFMSLITALFIIINNVDWTPKLVVKILEFMQICVLGALLFVMISLYRVL